MILFEYFLLLTDFCQLQVSQFPPLSYGIFKLIFWSDHYFHWACFNFFWATALTVRINRLVDHSHSLVSSWSFMIYPIFRLKFNCYFKFVGLSCFEKLFSVHSFPWIGLTLLFFILKFYFSFWKFPPMTAIIFFPSSWRKKFLEV